MSKKKRILFYSQVCYLDIAIEYIKLLSNYHEVHVFIELPKSQLKSNILNLNINLQDLPDIIRIEEVLHEWRLDFLKEYFEKCDSVSFINHNANKVHKIVFVSRSVSVLIKKINPDYIHMDDISARSIFLLPTLIEFRQKLILNIHDPKPHIGEFEWKRALIKKIFFKMVSKFVVFSNYSYKELKEVLPSEKCVFPLRLMPYTVYRKFINGDILKENASIVFVGRISPYKGVELFLEAIAELKIIMPKTSFIIAGKPISGYQIQSKHIVNMEDNVKFVERHLSNEEISTFISNAQLVICPYLEATQSGVIMTALALNRPVLATKVGALPEYIEEGKTGLIMEEFSSQRLKALIIEFIEKEMFLPMMNCIRERNELQIDIKYNLEVINQIYR